jgi:hemerythrin-like domain-containing protein
MMGKATEDLRKEHDSILHALRIVDKMLADDLRDDELKLKYYEEVVYFFKTFADKCHHGKEENYFLDELTRKEIQDESGLIREILEEHERGREYISLMEKSIENKSVKEFEDAAVQYRDLLIMHIDKENNYLFKRADQLLSEEDQNELFEKFEKYEEDVIGHGIHEKLHSMIHNWEKEGFLC